MTNFSQWLNDILKNEKLLRDIRTGVAITAALLLALIYWGFIQNFNFSGLEITKIVGLTIVFSVSVFIVRIEFKARGFQAEMDENEELKKIEKDLFDEDVNIINDELGIEWVEEFNHKGQDKANRLKTEKRINKLMQKRREYLRRNKPITAIDEEIDRLKKEPLLDTKYKPIRYTDLISKGSLDNNKKDVLDRDQIYYNPVKQDNIRGFASTILRSIIPGSLGIGFLLNEPFINILLYYVFLLISFAWTISTQYILVRRQTANRYFITRQNTLTLLREMKLYINQQINSQKDLTNIEQTDNNF
jgi:hypothetical protein